MKNASAGLVLTLLISMSAAAPAQDAFSPEKRQVIAEVDALESQIADMSMELWNFSEIALKEHQSAEFLADILEAEGFTVERAVADMPTAFVAEWGGGEPVIGILAEYDALPDIGNDPVPMRQERDDGHPHGQGCGHNSYAATALGAALATKAAMETLGLPGTIKCFGCPAEETLVGKVFMVRDGVFDGLDACLGHHPGSANTAFLGHGNAMNSVKFEFFGKASHAAGSPEATSATA